MWRRKVQIQNPEIHTNNVLCSVFVCVSARKRKARRCQRIILT